MEGFTLEISGGAVVLNIDLNHPSIVKIMRDNIKIFLGKEINSLTVKCLAKGLFSGFFEIQEHFMEMIKNSSIQNLNLEECDIGIACSKSLFSYLKKRDFNEINLKGNIVLSKQLKYLIKNFDNIKTCNIILETKVPRRLKILVDDIHKLYAKRRESNRAIFFLFCIYKRKIITRDIVSCICEFIKDPVFLSSGQIKWV